MKLFKSRNKRASRNGFEKRNRRRSNRALRAELLEDKILLAGDLDIVLDTGVSPNELYVVGTGSNKPDNFKVEDIDLLAAPDDDVQVSIWLNNQSGTGSPDLRDTYDTSTLKAMALLNGAVFTGFKLFGGPGDKNDHDVMDASFMKFQGDVTLYGENGNDTLTGGKRADAMHGGSGNDLLLDADNLDTALTGGDRQDELLWRAGVSGVHFINADVEFVNGTVGNDTIDSRGGNFQKPDGNSRGVEVDAGAGNDRLYGSGNGDTLWGGTGIDTIYGEGGNDKIDGGADDDKYQPSKGHEGLHGGDGNDTIAGGSGGDAIWGDGGNDVVTGDAGDDTIDGGAGTDNIHGNDGNDHLKGGDGNDKLFGDADNDTLEGGPGADELDGGPQNGTPIDTPWGKVVGDTAVYTNSFGGIKLELAKANPADRVSGGEADGDKLIDIENVAGSDFAPNNMQGDSGPNALIGGDSKDSINGHSGDDTILGQGGNDTLVGEWGDDIVQGGGGDDIIEGDGIIGEKTNNSKPAGIQTDGDDLLDGGAGNDRIFANYDFETATHEDLKSNNAVGTDVLFGGDGNDFMRGDGGQDTLQGDGDADNLDGFKGVDVLVDGNSPNDVLTTEFDPALTGPTIPNGSLVDFVVMTGSGPDTIIVTDTTTPLGRATATNQLLAFSFSPFSDYDPSIDTLLFV
jgi:Ca2+-binding RTX toxin-like protein